MSDDRAREFEEQAVLGEDGIRRRDLAIVAAAEADRIRTAAREHGRDLARRYAAEDPAKLAAVLAMPDHPLTLAVRGALEGGPDPTERAVLAFVRGLAGDGDVDRLCDSPGDLVRAWAEPPEPVHEPVERRRWDAEPPKAREWLVPKWLPAGRVAILTGEGGSGKSRLAVQLAATLAGGSKVWIPGGRGVAGAAGVERMAADPAPVVLATWEDEDDEVARWLWARPGADGEPGADARAVGDRLRYLAPTGSLWEPDPTGSRHTSTVGVLSATGQALRAYCEALGAALLIVDPRAAAYGLNENDRGLVRAFMASWDSWARDAGCAVLLVNHPPKGEDRHGISGSTDWHAAARAVWRFEAAETHEGEKEPGEPKARAAPGLRLECVKSSYAAIPSGMWMRGYPFMGACGPREAARYLATVRGLPDPTEPPDYPPCD